MLDVYGLDEIGLAAKFKQEQYLQAANGNRIWQPFRILIPRRLHIQISELFINGKEAKINVYVPLHIHRKQG
jgi:hypothetical protein